MGDDDCAPPTSSSSEMKREEVVSRAMRATRENCSMMCIDMEERPLPFM
jgi:hypothetical protein